MKVQLDTPDLARIGPDCWFDDGDDPVVGRWTASTAAEGRWCVRIETPGVTAWRSIVSIGRVVDDRATLQRLVPHTDAAFDRYVGARSRTDLQLLTDQEEAA